VLGVDFRPFIELWHRNVQPGRAAWLGTLPEQLANIASHRRDWMTTFNEREKSFEKKFALDEELKFKSEQRRNKLLGEWAAAKLGITGTAVDEYVRALRKADLTAKGDQDVFQKVRTDFDAKGVAVNDADLRRAMSDFLAEAVSQIEGERKGA
jgi:hypothetical protein